MKIDDKTTIPIVMVLAGLPFIIGAIFWLTSMDAKAQKALDQNVLSKEVSEKLETKVNEIQKSVQRIEIKLGTHPTQKGE